MRLSQAIVCPPGNNFADGLTVSGLGPPDLALARAQHAAYVQALEECGLTITRIEPDRHYPDGTFVEDTAVVTARGAMLTRPGAESRQGEEEIVGKTLADHFQWLEAIKAPGTLDGGDVCEAAGHFFIGRSERTNDEGARQLAAWLAGLGWESTVLDIRALSELLHLKSGLAHLGGRRLAAVGALARHPALEGWNVLRVPAEEQYAANCVRVNDTLLVSAGFPRMAAAVREPGLRVVELEVSEFRKMDGGLSCLSLRW
jgi:dimethylargininase